MMSESAEDALLSVGRAEDYVSLGQALLGDNRRSSPRVELNLLARCLFADATEAPALIRDSSCSGLSIDCYKSGVLGEPVIIYVDHLGRFEGTIARRFQTGFAVYLRMTDYRREKLRLKLEALAKGELPVSVAGNGESSLG